MKIITDQYKISADRYFKIILSLWLERWWWVVLLPVCAQLVMALFNVAFVYTTFITIFLIYPPILMFVYYSYALSPISRFSILNKHIEITDVGISVIFDKENDDDINIQQPKHYRWDEISMVFFHKENILFQLSSGKYHIIVFPCAIAQSPQQLDAIIASVKTNRA